MASFPPRSIFDTVSSKRGVDGAASQPFGASDEIHQGLVRVKERLQKVNPYFIHLPVTF